MHLTARALDELLHAVCSSYAKQRQWLVVPDQPIETLHDRWGHFVITKATGVWACLQGNTMMWSPLYRIVHDGRPSPIWDTGVYSAPAARFRGQRLSDLNANPPRTVSTVSPLGIPWELALIAEVSPRMAAINAWLAEDNKILTGP